MVRGMTRLWKTNLRRLFTWDLIWGLVILVTATGRIAAEPPAAADSAFNSYIFGVESRVAGQHRSHDGFLAPVASGAGGEARLRQGEFVVERIRVGNGVDLPGAMVHDWRGTVFVRGAKAADFEQLMRAFNDYPRRFAPQVVQAKILTQRGDHFEVSMRVCQKHVITVVMDSSYDVMFGRLDAEDGYSISRSTRMAEIDSPGTSNERVLSASKEHGFLWRLNTYWSYEERDGGLYLQIESVSLTRAIPAGLGWAVGPFVERVPRESLEFTLRKVCDALQEKERTRQ
jgi:hypothetical protein